MDNWTLGENPYSRVDKQLVQYLIGSGYSAHCLGPGYSAVLVVQQGLPEDCTSHGETNDTLFWAPIVSQS